jgi:hypothetical protein
MQLFSVVFYVVTAVHKIKFWLVINRTPNGWQTVKGKPCTDTDSFLTGSTRFAMTVIAGVKGSYQQCVGQLHSLE